MEDQVFDYAIIGAGAAGLNLVLIMLEDDFFTDKKILILDKAEKNSNDRTWCFWEKESQKWDHITTKIWDQFRFITNDTNKEGPTSPYRYKMIRSADFYRFARQKINDYKNENLIWIKEEVVSVEENDQFVTIVGSETDYRANHVFDSRINQEFFDGKDNYKRVIQHFKGWWIETKKDIFNPDEFVMMDYRLKWDSGTNFMYVLPLDRRKALVEFTFFTPYLIEEEGYDQMTQKYINDILAVDDFTILETEKGSIPMSDYPFYLHHTEKISKVGTAGGWVRPSSGYSFKNAERYSQMMVKNIKDGKSPHNRIARNRFRKYDTIFLELLQNRNELGEGIFKTMYVKNDIGKIFKFLDEETTFIEDIAIINRFNPFPFIKSSIKNLRYLLR